MTYCIGIKLDNATVMISDSRTNAGVDNVSAYSKMWRFGVPGERQFVLCSAGNLATTQAVISKLKNDISLQGVDSLANITSMHAAAEYIGAVSVSVQKKAGGGPMFQSTFLLAGEIKGDQNVLQLIYPQGNYINSSSHAPFFQIGESKYGKPILDRVIQPHTSVESAITCGLISMDATMKSNLTVGPPIELSVLEKSSLQMTRYRIFGEDDDYIRNLRHQWNSAVVNAIDAMPGFELG